MKYKHIGKPSDQINDSQSKLDDSLSRRSFLRNSSTASVGAGLIVTSKTALGQEGSDKGKKVRCGIVGYGDEGKALRESSMFLKDLVCFPAVSDIWPRNLRAGKGQISASKQGGGADGSGCRYVMSALHTGGSLQCVSPCLSATRRARPQVSS